MRLIQKGTIWEAHFTQVWEITLLEEQPEGWIPFFLIGHGTPQEEPVGEIHTRTHEIKLHPGRQILNRQVVALRAK